MLYVGWIIKITIPLLRDGRTQMSIDQKWKLQKNMALRRLLREAHGRERILKEAVEYCKAMAIGGSESSYRDCIYGKCQRALEEIKDEAE